MTTLDVLDLPFVITAENIYKNALSTSYQLTVRGNLMENYQIFLPSKNRPGYLINDGNGVLSFEPDLLANNIKIASGGSLEFYSGTDTITIKSPTSISSSYNLTLPAAQGFGFLRNNGLGDLDFLNEIVLRETGGTLTDTVTILPPVAITSSYNLILPEAQGFGFLHNNGLGDLDFLNEIVLRETGGTLTDTVTISPPTNIAASYSLILPTAQGLGFLRNNGSGGLDFLNEIILRETGGTLTDTVTILPPADITASYSLILPAAQGLGFLRNNGSGGLDFLNEIILRETGGTLTDTVTILPPADVTASYSLILPAAQGLGFLRNNGSGGLDFLNEIVLRETGGTLTDTVTILPPADITTSYTLTLPADDGDDGEFLQTNGSGTLIWALPFAAYGNLYKYFDACDYATWTASANYYYKTNGTFGLGAWCTITLTDGTVNGGAYTAGYDKGVEYNMTVKNDLGYIEIQTAGNYRIIAEICYQSDVGVLSGAECMIVINNETLPVGAPPNNIRNRIVTGLEIDATNSHPTHAYASFGAVLLAGDRLRLAIRRIWGGAASGFAFYIQQARIATQILN